MPTLRENIESYVKRVKELVEHVKGNEQATRQSLIGPFFTMLGYDLTDPRECMPEYKADFGKNRSIKPVDWAFLHNGQVSVVVEAKEAGRKLAGFDEQLADYFAKDPSVKLGILTNGVQWRFFTDVVNSNVMDREPFAKWDILADEPAPHDVITLLQKSAYNAELIRAYAQRQRAQNLLVGELCRLLEPAPEFTKLAVANIETRNLTQAVVESWKPVVASAISEWARQRMLSAALSAPPLAATPEQDNESSKIVTTQAELDASAMIAKILGDTSPVGHEDSASYFKIHVAKKPTWVIARLQLSRRQPIVWVPMSIDETAPLIGERTTSSVRGWTLVTLDSVDEIEALGSLFRHAYDYVIRTRAAGGGED